MLSKKRKVIWLAASVVLCGFLALSSVEGKGKPGGGGEDPATATTAAGGTRRAISRSVHTHSGEPPWYCYAGRERLA